MKRELNDKSREANTKLLADYLAEFFADNEAFAPMGITRAECEQMAKANVYWVLDPKDDCGE